MNHANRLVADVMDGILKGQAMYTSTRSVTTLLSVALFLAACVTPATDFGPKKAPDDMVHGVKEGFFCLIWGWGETPCWLANPLLLIGWVVFGRWPAAAALTGLIAFSLGVVYLNDPYQGRPALIGAYLWVASMGVLSIGAIAKVLSALLPAKESATDVADDAGSFYFTDEGPPAESE